METPRVAAATEDSEQLVFEAKAESGFRGPIYCRSWNSTRERLERELLALYGLEANSHSAFILPSGMAAIGATLASLAVGPAPCKTVIVHGDELYKEVPRQISRLVEAHALQLAHIACDIRDGDSLQQIFQERGSEISVFHFEACTNPSGQLFDFSMIPELRKLAPECVFVADNTWLSGVLLNPLELGADVVIESMTKYISAGRCIGGAVIGSDGIIAKVLSWIKMYGQFVGADHCAIFLKGLQDVHTRVIAASRAAEEVARHLEDKQGVSRVMYPLLKSHPTFHLAEKLLAKGGPGCVWFHVHASPKAIRRALSNSVAAGAIEFKTSFGGQTARIDPWPQRGNSLDFDWRKQPISATSAASEEDDEEVSTEAAISLVPQHFAACASESTSGTWLRLALGYRQDLKEVLMALDELLKSLRQP